MLERLCVSKELKKGKVRNEKCLPLMDFLQNRLPSLVFAAAQVPLLWINYERSIVEAIRGRIKPMQKAPRLNI